MMHYIYQFEWFVSGYWPQIKAIAVILVILGIGYLYWTS